jgi:FHA domain/Transcriptional regulatory protein, C terminal
MLRDLEDFPTIVAQTGPLSGQRWFIQDTITLGRGLDCDVVIPSRQVSRYHARITNTTSGILLEDLGSKNGTHHNGKSIQDIVELQDGDTIQIALAQQFIYLSSDATLPLEGHFPDTMQDVPRRLRLDERSHRVWINDREVLPPLSISQFQLLDILYNHQAQVVPRVTVIESVWGDKDAIGVTEQALHALIRRLRDRLASVDPTHNYVITVRGHGLRLDNPPLEPV